jgi:hypothetical protein
MPDSNPTTSENQRVAQASMANIRKCSGTVLLDILVKKQTRISVPPTAAEFMNVQFR